MLQTTRQLLANAGNGVFESEDQNVSLTLGIDLVQELGDPDEITVTIEPGDKLNS